MGRRPGPFWDGVEGRAPGATRRGHPGLRVLSRRRSDRTRGRCDDRLSASICATRCRGDGAVLSLV